MKSAGRCLVALFLFLVIPVGAEPQPTERSQDPLLQERIELTLTTSNRFDDLEVAVTNGVVFLKGKAKGKEFVSWAEELARSRPGVHAVVNELEAANPSLRWTSVWTHLMYLTIAYVLALPIAWNREYADRSAGLRTFPLVCIASCGFALTGLAVLGDGDAQARVMYGIMTGIGFIGGGAILKDGRNVRGTATAASLWNTAAIGVAVAWGQFEIAVVLSIVNFLTLRYVAAFKPGPEETAAA